MAANQMNFDARSNHTVKTVPFPDLGITFRILNRNAPNEVHYLAESLFSVDPVYMVSNEARS